ncbi:MAG: hypothetical protein DRG78_11530 [Epsilonproteobacteria bacterium]|nr:MAG: hypothetical protein DRG78_11530 [Campylobacterota bacterium]
MTVTPIIMNYNLPNITDEIYTILESNGFENIISIDNGSDIEPRASSSNFILPKNVRVSGQARMALIYLMDYFPSDYYLLINNSGKLLSEINYKDIIEKDIKKINKILSKKKKLGVLVSSLLGESAQKDLPYQIPSKEYEYSSFFSPQPICMAISHDLLGICRKNSSSVFNLDLFRGHGIGPELLYEANCNGFLNIISSNFYVDWISNRGYNINKGGEEKSKYHDLAGDEMKMSFCKKYGYFWRYKFYFRFYLNTLIFRNNKKLLIFYDNILSKIYSKLQIKGFITK